jgi:hypothetical protein
MAAGGKRMDDTHRTIIVSITIVCITLVIMTASMCGCNEACYKHMADVARANGTGVRTSSAPNQLLFDNTHKETPSEEGH